MNITLVVDGRHCWYSCDAFSNDFMGYRSLPETTVTPGAIIDHVIRGHNIDLENDTKWTYTVERLSRSESAPFGVGFKKVCRRLLAALRAVDHVSAIDSSFIGEKNE